MKKRVLFLLTWLVSSTLLSELVVAQQKPYSLIGTISGQQDGQIYLTGFLGKGGRFTKDSARIVDGRFHFNGYLEFPTEVYLTISNDGSSDKTGNTVSVFLEPTEMAIQLKKNAFDDAIITGSQSQNEFAQLRKEQRPIRTELAPLGKKYDTLNLEYIAAMRRTKNEDSLKYYKDRAVAAKDAMDPYIERLDSIDRIFIATHPSSWVTASLMRYKVSSMSADEVKVIYNKLPPDIKESTVGKNIFSELKALEKGSPGAQAYVFSTTDINNRPLTLSQFRGKYVLLDFWASWCVPCRRGNPHLLSLYSKYKDKGFEIIGISDDDNKPEAWKKAVEKDGIGVWKHVLRGLRRIDGLEMFDRSKDISDQYGIHTLPTKILVNPQGVIIGRYGGGGESDEAMDEKLKEVFTQTTDVSWIRKSIFQ